MASPSGFENAPITKGLLGLTIATSVLTSMFNLRHLFALTRVSLMRWELWRAVTHHFFFADTGELLMGLLLVYYFRLFERLMGSKKYFVFVVFSLVLSTLLEISFLTLFPFEGTFSGLQCLLFSALVLYWTDVPPFYRFTFFGIPANSKLFSYFLALQLLFSRPGATTQAIIGLLVGILYRLDISGLSSYDIPGPLAKVYSLFVPNQNTYTTTIGQRRTPVVRAPQQNTPQRQPRAQQPRAPAPVQAPNLNNIFGGDRAAPSEANISYLVNMGFPRDQAAMALVLNGNQVELALNTLLGA
eukprot:TRINITY_DN6129_c0_g1_i1.p1 TRINITY_DN6129_c0_g1~~TRINITY_DN6129_c0_g1_i1.p1  ORF type:complete len:300 (+),score=43.39 TRINITY_DN6129_c0_g1_i1:359-1258(+)